MLFDALNAGKKGFGLNLKHPDAASVIHRIISEFDVVIEGNRPGVMDRLGIGYDALSKINPKIIYCSLSGYGSTGPMSTRAGHDVNYMAIAGLLGLTRTNNNQAQLLGFQAADSTGSLQGALGIMAALLERGISGTGQKVDISLTESAMVLAMPSLSLALAGVDVPPGKGMLDGGLPNYNVYKTSDGKSISVGSLEPHFWGKICTHIDRKDLMSPKTTYTDVEQLFLSKSAKEWAEIAIATDACMEIVLSPEELVQHPQHVSRKVFLSSDEEINGNKVKDEGDNRKSPTISRPPQMVVGPRLSKHPATLLPPASSIGGHTIEILKSCGLSNDEIDSLTENGVISCD